MQLPDFVGYHSGINKLTFLLLYEVTLVVKLLQTFRQTVMISRSKGRRLKATLTFEYVTTIFLRKVLETIIQ